MHTRSKWFLVGLVATWSACLSSHDDEVSRERCEALRDHMIELRLDDIDPTPNPYVDAFHRASASASTAHLPAQAPPLITSRRVDRRAHRAAMLQALGDRFVTTCQSKATASQLQCVLDAKSSTAATACYRTGRSS